MLVGSARAPSWISRARRKCGARRFASASDSIRPGSSSSAGGVFRKRLAAPVGGGERSGLALEVADSEGLAVLVELGVLLRYGVRGQAELEPGLPTYPEGERVDRDSPELPAAFHEAFQEPTKSGGARRGRRGRFVGHIRGQR